MRGIDDVIVYKLAILVKIQWRLSAIKKKQRTVCSDKNWVKIVRKSMTQVIEAYVKAEIFGHPVVGMR